MSSDTPRTDAALEWVRPVDQTDTAPPNQQYVDAEFAQELERENAELRQSLLTREQGGEWVSRCDHEDEIAELLHRQSHEGGRNMSKTPRPDAEQVGDFQVVRACLARDLERELTQLRAALGIPDSYTHDRAVAEAVECREARLLLEFTGGMREVYIKPINKNTYELEWVDCVGNGYSVRGRDMTELLTVAEAEEQE